MEIVIFIIILIIRTGLITSSRTGELHVVHSRIAIIDIDDLHDALFADYLRSNNRTWGLFETLI